MKQSDLHVEKTLATIWRIDWGCGRPVKNLLKSQIEELFCQNVMWRVGHGGVGSEGQVRSLKKVTGFPVSR